MIFYFTGTGNSLYAAKQLEDDLTSIPQVMRGTQRDFAADSIGIVSPVYGHEVPPMVRDFLRESRFHTDYFYMVLTYGNRHGGAAELAGELCRQCGIVPNYINILQMVDNWLPAFDMDEQKLLDKHIEENLHVIREDIRARKNAFSPVTEADREAHRSFLQRVGGTPKATRPSLLRVTESCTGCGICQKVCPTATIQVRGGRAEYTGDNCQTCLACAHACPQKAIRLTVPEKNPRVRYRNEHISLQEIIAANCQNC